MDAKSTSENSSCLGSTSLRKKPGVVDVMRLNQHSILDLLSERCNLLHRSTEEAKTRRWRGKNHLPAQLRSEAQIRVNKGAASEEEDLCVGKAQTQRRSNSYQKASE